MGSTLSARRLFGVGTDDLPVTAIKIARPFGKGYRVEAVENCRPPTTLKRQTRGGRNVLSASTRFMNFASIDQLHVKSCRTGVKCEQYLQTAALEVHAMDEPVPDSLNLHRDGLMIKE